MNSKTPNSTSDVADTRIKTEMADWILRIAEHKDCAAFKEIFTAMAPRIKGFLVSGGADPAQAEEVMQEVMIKIWRKAAYFDPAKASASTWIFTIARNTRIDIIRREKRPELDPNDPALHPIESMAADEVLSLEEQKGKIYNMLKSLPKEQSYLIKLAFYGDLSHSQIAKEADIPIGTVKSRIRLALAKLKVALE